MNCPKGHESEESDFCSVCGAKMAAAPPPAVPPPAVPPHDAVKCPDCAAPRHPEDTVFCEDCGYNFTSGAHGEKTPEPPAVLAEWELTISVDLALKAPESPEPPADFTPSSRLLLNDAYLIGRTSEKRGVHPEISLDADDAVSHRHAILTRNPDGGFTLRDVGSSNGTRLNGNDVPPLTDTPLQTGDVIAVGHWTKLAIRRAG